MPYDQGGPTRRDNLALTCRRHNQTKSTGTGWTYRHNPDGTYTWTTATGHHYTDPPPANREQPTSQRVERDPPF